MKAGFLDFDFMPIGQAIKQGRERMGETRDQIASILFMSPRHIQGIENEGNYPSVELLIWFAKRYHVSLDQFIFEEESKSKSTARRNAEEALDKLNDQELAYIEQMAKGLYALREPED